jgi:polar amino acid transport system permease protein
METGIAPAFFSTEFTFRDLMFMIRGAGVTILLTVVTAVGGTVIGFLVGWARTFDRWYINGPLGFYIDAIRAVPLIVLFILVHSFSGVIGIRVDPFISGLVTLNLWLGAFVAEVARAGIESVSINIVRAGRGLGLTYLQNFRHVVVPIGVKAVFPAWVGLVLGMMKSTALITVLGVTPPELLHSSRILIDRIPEPLLILLGAGAIYFALCYPLSRLAARIEKRWAVYGGLVS